VKNLGMSTTRPTLTNVEGTYSISLRPVGSFELAASAAGFQNAISAVESALTGAASSFQLKVAGTRPEDLFDQLIPKPDRPLHFSVAQNHEIEYMPYWQVADHPFTCFAVIDAPAG